MEGWVYGGVEGFSLSAVLVLDVRVLGSWVQDCHAAYVRRQGSAFCG